MYMKCFIVRNCVLLPQKWGYRNKNHVKILKGGWDIHIFHMTIYGHIPIYGHTKNVNISATCQYFTWFLFLYPHFQGSRTRFRTLKHPINIFLGNIETFCILVIFAYSHKLKMGVAGASVKFSKISKKLLLGLFLWPNEAKNLWPSGF